MYGIDGGTDCIQFWGIFCFGSSFPIDWKIEESIFIIDRIFYQQYHFPNAGSQRKEERNTRCFCDG